MFKLTKKKLSGFTLVELIVVITILVILGTIAFISLGGYSLSARDSARISDITNITKALEITLLKNGSVIPPDKGDTGIITITASGTTIGYQGYAASNVLSNIKMSEAKDPLDKKYYTYLTNANYTKYQVLTLLENSSTLTQNNTSIPGIDQVYAGYETRIPSTKGSSLGVLLGNTGTTLNQPVQESYSVSSFTGVDIFTQVFTGSSSFTFVGETYSPSEPAFPDNCRTWIKNYPSLIGKNGVYRIKPTKTINGFDVYCDMTTDGGGWTMVKRWGALGRNGKPDADRIGVMVLDGQIGNLNDLNPSGTVIAKMSDSLINTLKFSTVMLHADSTDGRVFVYTGVIDSDLYVQTTTSFVYKNGIDGVIKKSTLGPGGGGCSKFGIYISEDPVGSAYTACGGAFIAEDGGYIHTIAYNGFGVNGSSCYSDAKGDEWVR